MFSPRTIPTLLSGATFASAILAATAASADGRDALDWPQTDDPAAIVSFGGDSVSALPATSEGGGEIDPSPLSGTPASDDAATPFASQIDPQPIGAHAAAARTNEES